MLQVKLIQMRRDQFNIDLYTVVSRKINRQNLAQNPTFPIMQLGSIFHSTFLVLCANMFSTPRTQRVTVLTEDATRQFTPAAPPDVENWRNGPLK